MTTPARMIAAKERAALREQAQRCRRLAKSIYNPEVAAELEDYARQLEAEEAKLASRAPSQSE